MEPIKLGRYELRGLLGEGSIAEVWRAYDTVTDRVVALKLLAKELSEDDDVVARFRRQAQVVSRLNNAHVVPIHTYGEIDGRLYVDMRLIDGSTLRQALAYGPIEPRRAVRIVSGVAAALEAAHKAGLRQNDVNPSNILLDEDDFTYLIDLGSPPAGGNPTKAPTVDDYTYLAPERLTSSDVDVRSDVYALACVLCECLTGTRPFPGADLRHQIAQHLTAAPPKPSLSQPDLPSALDDVIAKGMAKEPDERYPAPAELAQAARDACGSSTPVQAAASAATSIAPEAVPSNDPAAAEPTPPKVQPTQQYPPVQRSKPILISAVIAIVAVIGMMAVTITDARLQTTLPFADLSYLGGVAVDNTGKVYAANRDTVFVLKESLDKTTLPVTGRTFNQSVLPLPGLNYVDGVAVGDDRAVYVTDWSRGRVLKLAEGSATPAELPFSGLRFPDGVAVDRTGAVYVADYGNKRVVVLRKGQKRQDDLKFNVEFPRGIAVDDHGTVYVTDTREGQVVAVKPGSTEQKRLPFNSLKLPRGVAVDNTGSVYVADTGNSRILMLAPGSNTQTELPIAGLDHPVGVAVDRGGNVYVSDSGNSRVVKWAAQ